jgi:hypothetical protein
MTTTEQYFGYNLENYEQDGLIAAWGARGILNQRWDKEPFGFVPGRISVIGDKKLTACIIKILNDGQLMEAIKQFVRDNRTKEYIVHDLWQPIEGRSEPLQVKIRMAGGYVYLRVGITRPEPMGSFKSYDEWIEAGKPHNDFCWVREGERPKVGSDINGCTLLTYCHEGPWQYAFVCDTAHTTKRGILSERKPYGRAWAFLKSVCAIDIK